MKRRNVLCLLLVLVCTFLFTGCGVKLVELTAEERTKIVDYAAHIVSEFNLRQEKGYLALDKETLDSLDENKTPEEDKEDNKPENGGDSSSNQGSDNNQENDKRTTFKQALGIQGLDAKTNGYETKSSYVEGSIGAINAKKGNLLVVVNCTLSNESEEVVKYDFSEGKIKFYIEPEAGKKVVSMDSFLEKILNSNSIELNAGESVELYLIFEITEKQAESLDDLELIVKNGDKEYTVLIN